MTHIKALAERWLSQAHGYELEAISVEERSPWLSKQLEIRAAWHRAHAAELEVAIMEEELDANPVIAHTPSRS